MDLFGSNINDVMKATEKIYSFVSCTMDDWMYSIESLGFSTVKRPLGHHFEKHFANYTMKFRVFMTF